MEQNAIIKSVELGQAHGCLSAWVHLDYGGTCQGFGGYVLYLPKTSRHHALLSVAGHFIWRVMEIAGVDRWEDVPGKTVRVRSDRASVSAIGHIVKDNWFYPEREFVDLCQRET